MESVPSQEAGLWVCFEPLGFCWIVIPWPWRKLLAGAESVSSNAEKRHAAACDQGLSQSRT